jgi:DNA-binding transcriptional ArsR family regulator
VKKGAAGKADPAQLLIAMQHPLRRQILQTMPAEGSISPLRSSQLLGQPLSNVSYHFRVLAKCHAIRLTGTEPVRGTVQHFYEMAITEPWARQALGLS